MTPWQIPKSEEVEIIEAFNEKDQLQLPGGRELSSREIVERGIDRFKFESSRAAKTHGHYFSEAKMTQFFENYHEDLDLRPEIIVNRKPPNPYVALQGKIVTSPTHFQEVDTPTYYFIGMGNKNEYIEFNPSAETNTVCQIEIPADFNREKLEETAQFCCNIIEQILEYKESQIRCQVRFEERIQ